MNALKNFQELFQGKPEEYKGKCIELELLPNTKPFHAKPFSIPKAYQQITKDETSRLEGIGILTKVASSECNGPEYEILFNALIRTIKEIMHHWLTLGPLSIQHTTTRRQASY